MGGAADRKGEVSVAPAVRVVEVQTAQVLADQVVQGVNSVVQVAQADRGVVLAEGAAVPKEDAVVPASG
jgi:hypothetical protein